MKHQHSIPLQQTPTLAHLFQRRVDDTPGKTAYIRFSADDGQWHEYCWREIAEQVARWQQAMLNSGLQAGDRVLIMCHNAPEWVICDQACLGLGLVLVPLFMNDRAENIAWIANDCEAAMLVIEGHEQWAAVKQIGAGIPSVKTIVSLEKLDQQTPLFVQDWLPDGKHELITRPCAAEQLATIVYTSGTTGRPKGVMLSHHNILWNIHAALKLFDISSDNLFLSFLPLSHTFERTVGYYLAMVTGAATAYNRSIPQLAEDLQIIKPTLMISVPRIFERIYARIMDRLAGETPLKKKLFMAAIAVGWKRFEYDQGRTAWSPLLWVQPLLDRLVGAKVRAKLGGRLYFTVCGGAALSPDVARLFIGLGIPVAQGYGLTETSPVIAANPLHDNIPDSVGLPLPGVEIDISSEQELLTRSPSVMLGYWNNPQATRHMIDAEGWLHTGDKARIDDTGHVYITGRLKEIIVLANGEKVPPANMENAIILDPLIDQAMVIGEGKPFLSALIVPAPHAFNSLLKKLQLDPDDLQSLRDPRLCRQMLERVQARLSAFPGYAQIHHIAILKEPLTPENGLLTPTLKLRRNRVLMHFSEEVTALYADH